jgi:hypothetical protein
MTPRPITLLWCLCSLAGATAGKAATGTVSASPAAPTAAIGSLATTTISWTSAGAATAQVWVSMDGAPESLFTQGVSGSQDAPWIQPGHDYRFQLYAGSSTRSL